MDAQSIDYSVVVEHPAGGFGCVRYRAGGGEGECRPYIEGKASLDAQGEGGKYRFLAQYEGVLVQLALGFLISMPRTCRWVGMLDFLREVVRSSCRSAAVAVWEDAFAQGV